MLTRKFYYLGLTLPDMLKGKEEVKGIADLLWNHREYFDDVVPWNPLCLDYDFYSNFEVEMQINGDHDIDKYAQMAEYARINFGTEHQKKALIYGAYMHVIHDQFAHMVLQPSLFGYGKAYDISTKSTLDENILGHPEAYYELLTPTYINNWDFMEDLYIECVWNEDGGCFSSPNWTSHTRFDLLSLVNSSLGQEIGGFMDFEEITGMIFNPIDGFIEAGEEYGIGISEGNFDYDPLKAYIHIWAMSMFTLFGWSDEYNINETIGGPFKNVDWNVANITDNLTGMFITYLQSGTLIDAVITTLGFCWDTFVFFNPFRTLLDIPSSTELYYILLKAAIEDYSGLPNTTDPWIWYFENYEGVETFSDYGSSYSDFSWLKESFQVWQNYNDDNKKVYLRETYSNELQKIEDLEQLYKEILDGNHTIKPTMQLVDGINTNIFTLSRKAGLVGGLYDTDPSQEHFEQPGIIDMHFEYNGELLFLSPLTVWPNITSDINLKYDIVTIGPSNVCITGPYGNVPIELNPLNNPNSRFSNLINVQDDLFTQIQPNYEKIAFELQTAGKSDPSSYWTLFNSDYNEKYLDVPSDVQGSAYNMLFKSGESCRFTENDNDNPLKNPIEAWPYAISFESSLDQEKYTAYFSLTAEVSLEIRDATWDDGSGTYPNIFRHLSESYDVYLNAPKEIYSIRAQHFYATTNDIMVFKEWKAFKSNGDPINEPLDDDNNEWVYIPEHDNRNTDIVFKLPGVKVEAVYTSANQNGISVVVEKGETLDIPAGGHYVINNPDSDFQFIITGKANIIGTPIDPIVFEVAEGSNPWDGFLIDPYTEGIDNTSINLENCKIKGVKNVIQFESYGASVDAHVVMRNCIVDDLIYENNQDPPFLSTEGNIVKYCSLIDPEPHESNVKIEIEKCTFNEGELIIMENWSTHINSNIFYKSDVSVSNISVEFYGNDCYECDFTDWELWVFNDGDPDYDNIEEDPLFVNLEDGDFHLRWGSPCIDRGWINSDNDPDGTRADIGAYYFPQISGQITENTTWSDELSIVDNVNVESGVTLTIEPGTKVIAEKSKKINIYGTLEAEGTSNDYINFVSANTGSSNRWGGIDIYYGGYLKLQYANVINASYGVKKGNSTGIADIQHCTFNDCYYGVYMYKNDDYPVNYCQFDNNTVGILAYYSDCNLEQNTFTNGYYGMLSYYSDNPIRGNTISNNSYGSYVLNCNPSFSRNEIDGNTSYGVYASSSSGPEMTTVRYYGVNDVNNYIHHNRYGVYSSSNSFPNLGIYYDSVPLRWGGFNLFKYNTVNSIKNTNTSHILMAEANWWRNEPGNYGSVDISPNADQALGMGPGSLPKATGTDTPNPLDNLLISAQILEMDSFFKEAIAKYNSVITLGYQGKIAQSALIGIERCYHKMDDDEGLINYLDNIHNNYQDEFIGSVSLYFSAGAYARTGDLEEAAARFQEVANIYQNTTGAQEETAWAMFDLGSIYEEMSSAADSGLSKSSAAIAMKAMAMKNFSTISKYYQKSEAAELLKALYQGVLPDIDIEQFNIPEEFALHPAYPNPFNPITTIRFDLPEPAVVNLSIYDILGREVWSLMGSRSRFGAGYHSITWDGTNKKGLPVSTGLYIIHLTIPGFSQTQKVILLK